MKKRKPAPRNGRSTAKKKAAPKRRKPARIRPQPPTFEPHPEPDDDPAGDDGLTEKQRLFVKFYVGKACFNATKAAALAGYNSSNNESLRRTACDNLTKPHIQRALEKERGRRFGSADDVRTGISAIADSNAADFISFDANGSPVIDIKKMEEYGALGIIQSFETFEGRIKVKMYDRLDALKTLAKMNGQLTDQVIMNDGSVKAYADIDDGDTPATPAHPPTGPDAVLPPAGSGPPVVPQP